MTGEPRNTTRVLYYSSYLPLHGVDTVVRAAARLRDLPIHLRLIGRGPDFARTRQLADQLGLLGREVALLYVGDDDTDEDAFRMLRRRGTGFGIAVAPQNRRTQALYQLSNCDDVREFLRTLIDLHRRRPKS